MSGVQANSWRYGFNKVEIASGIGPGSHPPVVVDTRVPELQVTLTDPEYAQVVRDSQNKWRNAHPKYWKQYRQQHPEAVERNRQQQRRRDQRRRIQNLAKNNLALCDTRGRFVALELD